jgi:twitching motility protein PilT
MHVGEKPYVVTAGGNAELAASPLTVAAMTGMLEQLLPADSRQALNELGAVEFHLPADAAAPGIRYSVVAARGGDDIWIEVRRRKEAVEQVPVAAHRAAAGVAVEEPPPPPVHAPVLEAYEPPVIEASAPPAIEEEIPVEFDLPEPIAEPQPVVAAEPEPVAIAQPEAAVEPEPVAEFLQPVPAAPIEDLPLPEPPPVVAPEALEGSGERFELRPQTNEDFTSPSTIEHDLDDVAAPVDEPAGPALDFTVEPEPPAPAVIPMARASVRPEVPARQPVIHADPLHHLLYVAAGQGASALYVSPQAKPSLRVDGEIRVLDEASLTESQLETGVRAILKSLVDGAPLPVGEVATCEVVDVGRVQYLGFRDHRGLGAMFRMLPGRAISAEQAGLSAGIQALCTEPEGLVLVAGLHSAGKSTLVAALVDQINRTRRDHVITIESEIQFVHENRTSFISQREARDDSRFADALRAATREAADVLVIDGAMNPTVAEMALQAAADGQFVVASVMAPTTSAVLERFISFFGDEAVEARSMLSEHLRGVVTQALLRKTGGGRAAAREVLVNVPSVASLVASAQYDQIPAVLNSGRRVGMVPLNDALVGLVQNGALDVRQAYRKSPDQAELLGMLNKAGFDTTFAERLS